MKRCPTSLINTEIQIKTRVLPPNRMALIKKMNNDKCWQRCREIETHIFGSGDMKLCSCFGKHFVSCSKN